MKVLVTGGAGFIGSHIADFFTERRDEVTVLDNLSSGKIENIPNSANFIEGDITNPDDIEKAIDVDYVFHLAAMVSVPLSFKKPKKCFKTNIGGTTNILEAASKKEVKKVIFSSSAAIYGDNQNIPLKETEPYLPMSPYAESKVKGEQICQEYELETCVLRYFNVYGQRQDPKSPYSGVISIFSDRAKEDKDLIIFGDGKQTRDFIHVSDVVRANVLAMDLEGTFNVATGKEISLNKLAEAIIEVAGSESDIAYTEPREGDITHSVADISKISEEGFKPKTSLKKGLKTL